MNKQYIEWHCTHTDLWPWIRVWKVTVCIFSLGSLPTGSFALSSQLIKLWHAILCVTNILNFLHSFVWYAFLYNLCKMLVRFMVCFIGRYWANITDTILTGEFHQWKEGEFSSKIHKPGYEWTAVTIFSFCLFLFRKIPYMLLFSTPYWFWNQLALLTVSRQIIIVITLMAARNYAYKLYMHLVA